jgi:hypothetical protein
MPGLLAVLVALMAQLGVGASVPRADPIAALTGLDAICHAATDGAPSRAPMHPADCLVCPLCVVAHLPAAIPVASGAGLISPATVVVLRHELPPPSTAPPTSYRPPNQPRAPPIAS